MEWEELCRLCVDDFPTSTNRRYLAVTLEEVFEALVDSDLHCQAWIDGSFLTTKLDPADVDVVFVIDDEVYSRADEDGIMLLSQITSKLNEAVLCDAYVTVRYPVWHREHYRWVRQLKHWSTQFGYDRDGSPKGIALIYLGK